jgi:hypothetical protein
VTASRTPLVERATTAIIESEGTKFPMQRFVARRFSQAALEACRAEDLAQARRDLLDDTQHRDHACGDTPENCPVLRTRRLLAEIDTTN